MFFWQGELLTAAPSMPGSDPLEHRTTWEVVARRFQNPFLSIDVAREQSGAWLIIEIGDGGVTGLPMSIEAEDFYRALAERTRRLHS